MLNSRRVTYVALAFCTIVVGLLVHLRGSALGATTQDVAGDVLYAVMIAWWIGALFPEFPLVTRSVAAVTFCTIIEVSQLWHVPVIDAVRSTRIGHLFLGSGFDARDLAAYAAGVAFAATLEWVVRKRVSA